jgi:hypothetical protein
MPSSADIKSVNLGLGISLDSQGFLTRRFGNAETTTDLADVSDIQIYRRLDTDWDTGLFSTKFRHESSNSIIATINDSARTFAYHTMVTDFGNKRKLEETKDQFIQADDKLKEAVCKLHDQIMHAWKTVKRGEALNLDQYEEVSFDDIPRLIQ